MGLVGPVMDSPVKRKIILKISVTMVAISVPTMLPNALNVALVGASVSAVFLLIVALLTISISVVLLLIVAFLTVSVSVVLLLIAAFLTVSVSVAMTIAFGMVFVGGSLT